MAHAQELASQEDLDAFVNKTQDDRVLTVVAVTATGVSACVHVFPAVVALAKSFDGYAVFGRLQYNASPATGRLAAELNVTQVSSDLAMRRNPVDTHEAATGCVLPQAQHLVGNCKGAPYTTDSRAGCKAQAFLHTAN